MRSRIRTIASLTVATWLLSGPALGVVQADAGSAALLPHQGLPAGKLESASGQVDEYFSDYWSKAGVSPAPRIDDATFLRRLSLAVLGVPAKSAEVLSFIKDESPDKRRSKVDEMLGQSRYADYWGFRLRQWITDLREVTGQGANTYTLYRYTREAMAENRSWDRIAGDLLDSQGNILYDGNANFGVYLSGQPNEIAEGAGRLFLGMKISCAQCHDDPFHGAWTQQGYWSMAAFYGRTKMIQMNEGGAKFDRLFPNPGRSEASVSTLLGGDAAIDGEDGEKRAIIDRDEGEVYLAGKKKKDGGQALLPTPLDGKPLTEIDKANNTRRQAFVSWVTSRDNKQFARAAVNRFFLELTGRGFVPTADGFTPDAEIQHEVLLDRLADQFAEQHYDLKWLLRTIVNSQLFQTGTGSANNSRAQQHWQCFPVRPLNSDQWHDSVLRVSGREAKIEELASTAAGIFDLERNERLQGRSKSLLNAKKVLGEGGEKRRAAALPSTSDVPAPTPVEMKEDDRKRGTAQRRVYKELGEKLRRTRQMARAQLGPTGEALMQMNGRLITDSLRETDAPRNIASLETPEARLGALYLQILGRLPIPAERQRLTPAVADGNPERIRDVMWALMQSTEFLTY
ncbi:MAG: DUF1549 and DUF1553 domain-containing protein [Planctomycetes bacterium]|nr:DUF1549 and DUF1553 domain-containing protein [Planctomycetota bacterium]